MRDESNRKGGMLAGDGGIDYEQPAMVMGSDAKVYISLQDNTNRNPTTDTSDTYWEEFAPGETGGMPFVSLPSAYTSWNDLDNAIMPSDAYAAFTFVPGSNTVVNRPFNQTNAFILFLYRTGLSGTSPLMQIAHPIYNTNSLAGIGPFKRVRFQSNTWGDWGLEGGMFGSAYVRGLQDTDQILVSPVNIYDFEDSNVGHYTFHTRMPPTSGELPAIVLTCRNGNGFRAAVVSGDYGQNNDQEYNIIAYNANGAQTDPFALSIAMFIGAQEP